MMLQNPKVKMTDDQRTRPRRSRTVAPSQAGEVAWEQEGGDHGRDEDHGQPGHRQDGKQPGGQVLVLVSQCRGGEQSAQPGSQRNSVASASPRSAGAEARANSTNSILAYVGRFIKQLVASTDVRTGRRRRGYVPSARPRGHEKLCLHFSPPGGTLEGVGPIGKGEKRWLIGWRIILR